MNISGLFNALVQQYKDMQANRKLVKDLGVAIENDDVQALSRVLGQVMLHDMQKDEFVKAIIRRNNVEAFTVALRRLIDHDVNYRFQDTNFSAYGVRFGGAVFTASVPVLAYAIEVGAEDVALMLVNHRRTDVSARVEYDMSTAFKTEKTYGLELKEMARQADMMRVIDALYERTAWESHFVLK